MPLYEKSHSWGEFVFDWAWARAYEQAGLDYYPKLVSAVPFTPAPREAYVLDELDPQENVLVQYYPEVARCVSCNTCTKACPQELDVLSYVSAALRGDLTALANESFDCIMCGLCVARCPAEIVPPNVAMLGRRLYGSYLAPPAKHLRQRVQEIVDGLYQAELDDLKSLPIAELQNRYNNRQIEN